MATRDPEILVHPFGRLFRAPRGSILLDALRDEGIRIESICGGKGLCRKCRVILEQGEVEEIPRREGKGLSRQEVEQGYILACRSRVTGDIQITIPVESRIDAPKILITSQLKKDAFEPAVRCYRLVVVRQEELAPPGSPSARLESYQGPRPAVAKGVAELLRGVSGEVTAVVSTTGGYPEIISLIPSGGTPPLYGIALDLGTTTVVGALVDLSNGEILHERSAMNRQITYGEEVITRMACAATEEGRKKLQRAAVETVNGVVDALLQLGNVPASSVVDATIGGNTVMIHLLAGMDTCYLELANAEVSRTPTILRAKEIGFHANPEAHLYCLPCVSRFVGGDAVGDVLVSGMHESEDHSLLVDLGTNGEIVLGNREWLASTSCASGPAFEGGGIRWGMRGMRGAVDHVRIDPVTKHVTWSVIGDAMPRGICGSGIIDAIAEMWKAGVLDFTGRLVRGAPGVREGEGGLEFVLIPAEETGTGHDLTIDHADMAYLMDSKAALLGAVAVLMKKYRMTIRDIRHVYLAGAFGTYTDPVRLVQFGVLPAFPDAKYHYLGNGSLGGAFETLVSSRKRRIAELIAKKMVYIDLLTDQDFVEEYGAALYIPGRSDLFPEDAVRSATRLSSGGEASGLLERRR